MVEPKLFTVAEVAELLSVSMSTIRTWLAKGGLTGLKLPGGDWRVRKEELDKMLARGERPGRAGAGEEERSQGAV